MTFQVAMVEGSERREQRLSWDGLSGGPKHGIAPSSEILKTFFFLSFFGAFDVENVELAAKKIKIPIQEETCLLPSSFCPPHHPLVQFCLAGSQSPYDRQKMASIARRAGGSIAQLAGSLRHAATIGSAGRSALLGAQVASSSRTIRTSTVLAFTSSASSYSTPASPTDAADTPEDANAATVAKPKRKRRTKAEMEAARMAKLSFGVPMRSRRRTRTALGSATPASEAPKTEVTDKLASKRGRPRGKGRKAKELEEQARKQEQARMEAAESEVGDVLSQEVMEQLLSQMQYDHLPSRDKWKREFPISKQHQTSYRYFLSNRATIQEIIPHIGITEPERNGEKVTVVEGYPGPGTLTSELLKMPEVEKVIGLEATPCYLEKLELLQTQLDEKQPGAEQRLDFLRSSAYMWETYGQLVSSGKLAHLNNRVSTSDGRMVDFTTNDFAPPDHSDASWQKLSPIIFFAQLPNTVYGEQLFAQIVAAIAGRIWLFRHGRIKLSFICGESLAKRCLGEAGDKQARGKLGTTVQCLADVQVHRYAHELQPHQHHFFPPSMSVGPRVTVSGTSLIPNSNPSTGLTRTGMVMMTVTPKRNPLIKANEIEAFEFITRNLFILRTKPVGEALTHVAPGGQNVLKMTSPEQVKKGLIREDEVILPDELVCDLTNVQWANLARMFEKWPFRPRHLFEEGRIKRNNKGRN